LGKLRVEKKVLASREIIYYNIIKKSKRNTLFKKWLDEEKPKA